MILLQFCRLVGFVEDSEKIKVKEEADQQKDNENGSEQQNEQENDKVCCKSCLSLYSVYSNILGYVTSTQRAISKLKHSPRAD
jgi:hypothetical protein